MSTGKGLASDSEVEDYAVDVVALGEIECATWEAFFRKAYDIDAARILLAYTNCN